MVFENFCQQFCLLAWGVEENKKICKKGLIFSWEFGILVKPIGDTERYSNW